MAICRLFAYGMGIHLLQAEKEENIKHTLTWKKREINPRDDHISFQVHEIHPAQRDDHTWSLRPPFAHAP